MNEVMQHLPTQQTQTLEAQAREQVQNFGAGGGLAVVWRSYEIIGACLMSSLRLGMGFRMFGFDSSEPELFRGHKEGPPEGAL